MSMKQFWEEEERARQEMEAEEALHAELIDEGHSKECQLFYGGSWCDCWLSDDPEPPERRSKSAKSTHTRDGDSVKTIAREIGKRAKKGDRK